EELGEEQEQREEQADSTHIDAYVNDSCDISHTHDRAGYHHDFVHQRNVLQRDVVFKAEYYAGNEHERQYHGEAREDSTSYE
nr:hypothetical protein [Tanacetum cinerariifolium]